MLCICFYAFFYWPGDSKLLGSTGRQAEKYIGPEGKFFYVFYVPNVAYMNRVTIGAAVCTLTIRAAARNPNYWGCNTQP
jgi:hypothetical protein